MPSTGDIEQCGLASGSIAAAHERAAHAWTRQHRYRPPKCQHIVFAAASASYGLTCSSWPSCGGQEYWVRDLIGHTVTSMDTSAPMLLITVCAPRFVQEACNSQAVIAFPSPGSGFIDATLQSSSRSRHIPHNSTHHGLSGRWRRGSA